MLKSNPSLRNKSLRARNKVANVGLLQGDARPVPRYAVTETYGNQDFHKAKPKDHFITTTFGTSLFITQYQMRYSIYMPLNTKDLTKTLQWLPMETGITK